MLDIMRRIFEVEPTAEIIKNIGIWVKTGIIKIRKIIHHNLSATFG
jgi:hypothetical protein